MKNYLFRGQRCRAKSKSDLLRRAGLTPCPKLRAAIAELKPTQEGRQGKGGVMNKYDVQIAVWDEIDRFGNNWFTAVWFIFGPPIAFLIIIGIDRIIGRMLK